MKTAEGEEIVPTWHKEDDVEVVKNFVARVDRFIIEQLKETPETSGASLLGKDTSEG